MRFAWSLPILLTGLAGCGTAASVHVPVSGDAGSEDAGSQDAAVGSPSDSGSAAIVIADTPAGGIVRERPITIRSASVRLETNPDRRVLTLRDYASDCGVVQGGLPSADSVSVHVVLRRESPGEEIITLADNHSATFQIGIDPKTVETFAATSGRLRLDTYSTTPGDIVKGALALESSVGRVSGTFEAGVCITP